MLRRLLAQLRRPRRDGLERSLAQAAGLRKAGRLKEAERALRAVIAQAPGAARAHVHLGMLLAEQERLDDARTHLERAIALDPRDVYAHVNLGNVRRSAGDNARALEHYRAALGLQPAMPLAWSNMLRPLLDACDWDAAGHGLEAILALRERGERDWARYLAPMDALLLPVPPAICREVADHHATALRAAHLPVPRRAARTGEPRLRIGYLSRDFRDHAVGQLACALFRHHDRDRFEVFAYSSGRDDGSAYRAQIAARADRFVEVRGEPDQRIAARIAGDAIDLLVDLGGYTTEHLLGVLAARPAPVQAHYLGYPGTLGAGLADYYIADGVASPPGLEAHFSERLARVPGCFMVSDPGQPLVARAPARAELGLPADKVVLCAFHQSAKITREVFDSWCAILNAVPDAVLWLKSPGAEGEARLARRAREQGVAPDRLLYAHNVADKGVHVARMAAADLFLDTFGRYNGHSTVNEALWMGLPVVTLAGETFASRVATSLVSAAGMPELAAKSVDEYLRLAAGLARDAHAREALRGRLIEARKHAPLFDTAATVRAIERLYAEMWRLHRAGEAPRALQA
jgi:predicted O-linked N-acetylglucosamine transferase (SPINDLY family)